MATKKLEDRITAVETEIERLKQQIGTEKTQQSLPWYEKILERFRTIQITRKPCVSGESTGKQEKSSFLLRKLL